MSVSRPPAGIASSAFRQVVKDLQHPILVDEDRGQTRVVAPDDLHALLRRHLLGEERDPLEELVEVEGAKRRVTGRPRASSSWMIRWTRLTSLGRTSVYSPKRPSSPSSRFMSCTAPRMAESGFRIS